MPRLDGTGPEGRGPLTGRGLGNCNGTNNNVLRAPLGRGRGPGCGLGRGLGRMRCPYWNTPTDPRA